MRKILCTLLTFALFISALPMAYADTAGDYGSQCDIFIDGVKQSHRLVTVDTVTKSRLRLEAYDKNGKKIPVTWKSSDDTLVKIDDSGNALLSGEGSVSISCTCADGESVGCTVKLRLVRKVHRLSLDHYTGFTMRGETIVTLVPRYYGPDGNEYTPTSPKLLWEVLEGGDHASFANPSSGTLKAERVGETQRVRIRVSSLDESGAQAELSVTVSPVIRRINLFKGSEDVTGKTLSYSRSVPVQLSAVCTPIQNSEALKWSSSCSHVSVVNGLVSAKASCRVTITAAALDGSGKSASVTIDFT